LICTGSQFSISEKKQIEELGLTSKVFQVAADENTMVNLYYNAELFIYPSLYEGFGLPLLEAMNCHCPVVCSNASCFPEVAGNAAIYFNPYSIEDMAEVTNSILNNSSLKQKLINEGIERTKLFSWKTCANKHAMLYKTLLG
jgi:glycosyltransferase involved in cell wall biosynthesis